MAFLKHDIGNLSVFNGDINLHLTAVSVSASFIDAVRVAASAFFCRVRAACGSLAQGVLNRFLDACAGHAGSARGINIRRLRFDDRRDDLINRHLIDTGRLSMAFLKHDIGNLSVFNGDINLHLTAVSVSASFIDAVRIHSPGSRTGLSLCLSCRLFGLCLSCRRFRFCLRRCAFRLG